jgi:TRAP-type mannitol/chloroaromatic compound transport system permease small subunit
MLNSLAFFLDNITRFVGYLAAIVLIGLVLLITYDATMRYLFQTGSIALQELEWHLFDGVILLGIAYTLQKNAHVRVDIFYEHFSEQFKMYLNVFSILFFILPFSLLIIYIGYEFTLFSFEQLEGSSNPGGLPFRFVVKSLMPLAFVFVVLQACSEIIKLIKKDIV